MIVEKKKGSIVRQYYKAQSPNNHLPKQSRGYVHCNITPPKLKGVFTMEEYTAKDFYKDDTIRRITQMQDERLLRSIWIIVSDFAKDEGIK